MFVFPFADRNDRDFGQRVDFAGILVKTDNDPTAIMEDCKLHDLYIHDTTSDFAGTKMLIEKLGSQDKTLVAYNRGNHVITLDYQKEALEETAVEWLKRRSR